MELMLLNETHHQMNILLAITLLMTFLGRSNAKFLWRRNWVFLFGLIIHCIAVAELAVHVPAEYWGDGDIVKWLRDEMNSHPEFIPRFLELLTVLPEVPEVGLFAPNAVIFLDISPELLIYNIGRPAPNITHLQLKFDLDAPIECTIWSLEFN